MTDVHLTGPALGLVASVFLACLVEAVEALTIVLAVGSTRSWRSAFYGVAAGIVVLGVLTALVGPAIVNLPIDVLRVVVGGLLLTFGLQWIRKAVLRAAGLKALHDEEAIFRRERDLAAGARAAGARLDAYAFAVSFKGTFLEGLEVIFIVITFGASQHQVGLASLAAVAAVLLVVLVGAIVHAPLSRVPENHLKFVVGVLLTSFGMFWSVEGAGAHWPGSDLALVAIIPATLAFALLLVAGAKRNSPTVAAGEPSEASEAAEASRAAEAAA